MNGELRGKWLAYIKVIEELIKKICQYNNNSRNIVYTKHTSDNGHVRYNIYITFLLVCTRVSVFLLLLYIKNSLSH
jgi:hypothetical protein